MPSFHSVQKYLNRLPKRVRDAVEQTPDKIYINGSIFLNPRGSYRLHFTTNKGMLTVERFCPPTVHRSVFRESDGGWEESSSGRQNGFITPGLVSADESEFLQTIDIYNKRVALCHDTSGWSMVLDRDVYEGEGMVTIRTVYPRDQKHAAKVLNEVWKCSDEGYRIDGYSVCGPLTVLMSTDSVHFDHSYVNRLLSGDPTYFRSILEEHTSSVKLKRMNETLVAYKRAVTELEAALRAERASRGSSQERPQEQSRTGQYINLGEGTASFSSLF